MFCCKSNFFDKNRTFLNWLHREVLVIDNYPVSGYITNELNKISKL